MPGDDDSMPGDDDDASRRDASDGAIAWDVLVAALDLRVGNVREGVRRRLLDVDDGGAMMVFN